MPAVSGSSMKIEYRLKRLDQGTYIFRLPFPAAGVFCLNFISDQRFCCQNHNLLTLKIPMDLKKLREIPSSYSIIKKALFFSSLITFTAIVSSVAWAVYVSKVFTEKIYIITEKGQAAIANSISTDHDYENYRLPEIKNHIKVFHRLFFGYDQFSYDKNINEALYLIGNSGKQLYLSFKANGHFARIQSQNLVQKLEIDSIRINDKEYPYHASVYGKLSVSRVDQNVRTKSLFYASFDLYNVARTENNPHGLLIENYLFRSEGLEGALTKDAGNAAQEQDRFSTGGSPDPEDN